MYSRVLDQETFAKVVAAAPKVESFPRDLAAEIVQVLALNCPDGWQYYEMPLKTLAEKLGEGVSEKMVGMTVRDLGLLKKRFNDGYRVLWNEKQIDLLMEALCKPRKEPEKKASGGLVDDWARRLY